MRRIIKAAIGAAGFVWFCGSAQASVHTIFDTGAWSAYSGTSDDGTLLCGLAAGNLEPGQSFSLKYFAKSDSVEANVVKSSWVIPKGTAIPIELTIDDNAPLTVKGRGAGTRVVWYLPLNKIDEFQNEFEAGEDMTLAFPGGTEAPWLIALTGSFDSFEAFQQCIASLAPNGQPRPPATQPFGSTGPQSAAAHSP